MTAKPENGYLLIADLTGYTAYLSRSEIEHAPTIAGDLLEAIVGRLEPPFRLAKFEGDAAFLFVEDGRADTSLLLDAIEASYVAFRRRLRSIEQATSCDCNACRRAPRLDLKFFVHHGTYVRTAIAGRDELAGPAVILVHRLLKGTTSAAQASAGSAAGYALFSGAATAGLGLDPAALGFHEASEEIPHLGAVTTFVMDLERRWQDEIQRRQLSVPDDRALLEVEVTVGATPAEVWSHVTSPALRPQWEGPIVISEAALGGRRGIGTTAQCVTGRLATLEEIVDWQPYDHVGYRLAIPGIGPVEATLDLEPVDRTTRLRLRWGRPSGSEPDLVKVDELRNERQAAYERLVRILGGDHSMESAQPPATGPEQATAAATT